MWYGSGRVCIWIDRILKWWIKVIWADLLMKPAKQTYGLKSPPGDFTTIYTHLHHHLKRGIHNYKLRRKGEIQKLSNSLHQRSYSSQQAHTISAACLRSYNKSSYIQGRSSHTPRPSWSSSYLRTWNTTCPGDSYNATATPAWTALAFYYVIRIRGYH
jgi:hypothetical protein